MVAQKNPESVVYSVIETCNPYTSTSMEAEDESDSTHKLDIQFWSEK